MKNKIIMELLEKIDSLEKQIHEMKEERILITNFLSNEKNITLVYNSAKVTEFKQDEELESKGDE